MFSKIIGLKNYFFVSMEKYIKKTINKVLLYKN